LVMVATVTATTILICALGTVCIDARGTWSKYRN
jgi:hypothetical protein